VQKVERKAGPRETGRIRDWNPAEYDISDSGDFLKPRMSISISRDSVAMKKKEEEDEFAWARPGFKPEFEKSKSAGSSSSDSGKNHRSKSMRGPPSSRRGVQKNGPMNRSSTTRAHKSTSASKKFLSSRQQDAVSGSRNIRKSSEPVPKRSKSPARPSERKGSLASAERSRPNVSTDEQMHAENAGKSSDPPQKRTKLKAKWGLRKRDQSFGGGSKDTQHFDSDDVYE